MPERHAVPQALIPLPSFSPQSICSLLSGESLCCILSVMNCWCYYVFCFHISREANSNASSAHNKNNSFGLLITPVIVQQSKWIVCYIADKVRRSQWLWSVILAVKSLNEEQNILLLSCYSQSSRFGLSNYLFCLTSSPKNQKIKI